MALLVLMAICWTSRHVSSGLDNRQLLLLRCGGLGDLPNTERERENTSGVGSRSGRASMSR